MTGTQSRAHRTAGLQTREPLEAARLASSLLGVAAVLLFMKNWTSLLLFGSTEPDGREVSGATLILTSVVVPAALLLVALVLRDETVARWGFTGFVTAAMILALTGAVILGTGDDSAGAQAFFVLPMIWAAFYLRPLGFVLIALAAAAMMVVVAQVVTPGGIAGGVLFLIAAVLTTGVLIFRERRATEVTEQLLEIQANTDALTGLSSRRVLDEALDRGLMTPGHRLSLLLIDIDHFKSINDHGGHLAGDNALRAVASLIGGAAGPSDVACRMGGDEFALLLIDLDEDDALTIAERLCSLAREIAIPSGAGLRGDGRMSVSVGVARAPGDARDVAALYEAADRRLYAAKARGRARVVVVDRAE